MEIVGTAGSVTVTGVQFQGQLRPALGLVLRAVGLRWPGGAARRGPAAGRRRPGSSRSRRRACSTPAWASAPAAVPLAADCSMALPVVGVGGVPATGVAAVAVNVTATQAGAARVPHRLPVRRGAPATSTVNYAAGPERGQHGPGPASAPAGRSASTRCRRWTSSSTSLGWYGAGATAGYAPLTPTRVLDTRDGTGAGGQRTVVPAGGAAAFAVAGVAGIPADAAGVMLERHRHRGGAPTAT